MRALCVVLFVSLILLVSLNAGRQEAAGEAAADPEIVKIVSEVSAERIRKTIETLVGFKTRHVLSRTDSETEGTGAARSFLEKEMRAIAGEAGDRMTVERKPYKVDARRLGGQLEVVNLVATLRGEAEPDRIYVIGGHYDTRNSDGRNSTNPAPGANDDASGTAVALELCRVMSKRRFPATVIFVAFDAEEQGLLGSTEYAKELAGKEAKVDGMITCDIVGNTLGVGGTRVRDYVRCFSYAARGNDTSGRHLARAMADAVRRYVKDFRVKLVFRGDRYGRGGDHRPFMNEGWAAVRLTEPLEDLSRQHQNLTQRDGKPYGDVLEFVDVEYVANVARAAGSCLATLASAPPPPARLQASGRRDSYDTDLQVTPPETVVPIWGYEVLWRDTGAPDWEGARLFKAGGAKAPERLRLSGILLDDHVVGVRTVSPGGHRSRVTTPPEPDAFNQR